MSTNAVLFRPLAGKEVETIYVHWDGYPQHMFPVLANYNTPEKVASLFALGCISFLGPKLDAPAGGFNGPHDNNCTLAYGRDRGEKGQEAEKYSSIHEAKIGTSSNYRYIWNPESLSWEGL